MKHKIYAFYDSDIETYSEPFAAPNDEEIIEAYKRQLEKYQFARDQAKHKIIYQIANYDDSFGTTENLNPQRVVVDSNQGLKWALEIEREIEENGEIS